MFTLTASGTIAAYIHVSTYDQHTIRNALTLARKRLTKKEPTE